MPDYYKYTCVKAACAFVVSEGANMYVWYTHFHRGVFIRDLDTDFKNPSLFADNTRVCVWCNFCTCMCTIYICSLIPVILAPGVTGFWLRFAAWADISLMCVYIFQGIGLLHTIG